MADPTRRDDAASQVPRIVYRRKPGSAEEPAARPEAKGPLGSAEAPASPSSHPTLESAGAHPAGQRLAPPRHAATPLPGEAPPVRVSSRTPAAQEASFQGFAEAPEIGRRSAGIWLLAAVDFALALCFVALIRWLFKVKAYEIERSFDVAEELEMAVTGLNLMIRAAFISAGGFLVSAIALVSARRIGWLFALAWAVVTTLTGIGAVYGLPAFVYLVAPSTRSRFD